MEISVAERLLSLVNIRLKGENRGRLGNFFFRSTDPGSDSNNQLYRNRNIEISTALFYKLSAGR